MSLSLSLLLPAAVSQSTETVFPQYTPLWWTLSQCVTLKELDTGLRERNIHLCPAIMDLACRNCDGSFSLLLCLFRILPFLMMVQGTGQSGSLVVAV